VFTRRRLAIVKGADPRHRARRLRIYGVIVFVVGVAGAGVTYWRGTHRAEPSLEELLPGSTAARSRQTGLLYGRGVQSRWEVYQELRRPGAEAFIIAAAGAAGAALCFRMARLGPVDE